MSSENCWKMSLGLVGKRMRRILAIMAKSPILTEVKAESCPPPNPRIAERLHECLLIDTFEKASAVPDAEVVIIYPPNESLSYFRKVSPDAHRFITQEDSDPVARIADCFHQLCEPGSAVCIIGTDHPELPARSLELAFDALATGQVDVVFGPTTDERLYLIGATKPHPELFAGFGSDEGHILQKSIERAAELGLGWYLLPVSQRIDTLTYVANMKNNLMEEPAST